jgi:hypothetical protein
VKEIFFSSAPQHDFFPFDEFFFAFILFNLNFHLAASTQLSFFCVGMGDQWSQFLHGRHGTLFNMNSANLGSDDVIEKLFFVLELHKKLLFYVSLTHISSKRRKMYK